MAKKENVFKGKTLDELRKLNMDELADIMPSRIRRSLKRGLTHQQRRLLEHVRENDEARTHARDMPILPEMIGKTIHIHNGHEFQAVEIQFDMLGHFLGEFARTRKQVQHSAPGIGATRSSKYVPLK